MNKIEDFKYCLQTTKTHSLAIAHPRCLCAVKEIICNEGGRAKEFNDEQVVNLDGVEIELAKKERRCTNNSTMDVFLGVSLDRKSPTIALVEFKFNVKKCYQVSKSDLDKKIRGSIFILGNEVPIIKKYYIVFDTSIIVPAKAMLKRMSQEKPNNQYIAVTEQELKQIFW